MNRYILSLTLVFCTLFANTGQCQWVQTNMPGGGAISGLAIISGTNFFSGTNVGLFRSTDRGATWSAVNLGLPLLNSGFFYPVYPFAVGANLFVGTSGPGDSRILRSTDNGISWTFTDSGLPHSDIPHGFTSIDSNLFTVIGGGIYRSTNNGSSWTSVNTASLVPGGASAGWYWVEAIGTNLFACQGLFFPGVDPSLYPSYNLFRSTDKGVNWTSVKDGLPDKRAFLVFYGVTVLSYVQCLAAMGANILAGMGYKGIYRSTDNGTTWTAANSGITDYADLSFNGFAVIDTSIFAIAGADTGGGARFTRIFRSTDSGAHWTDVHADLPANMFVGSFTASGTDLFAGGSSGNYDGGIFKSTDNGTHWTASVSCLTGYRTNALLSSNGNLVAGTDIGICLSADNGTSWTRINSGPTATNPISCLATIGPNIIAGIGGNDTSTGIYYSTDNGKSWNTGFSDKTPGLENWVYSLAVSGTTIFAGTFNVLRSIDSGVTWTSLCDTGAFSLALMGTNIFAGSNQLGVIRSVDNGASWTDASSGLPTTLPDTLYPGWAAFIISLAVQGTNLYAATGAYDSPIGAGVFLSIDSGANWTAVNSGLPVNAYIRSFSVNGPQVFAATDTNGLFVTSDTGKSWSAVNSGLPGNTIITSMAISGAEVPNGLPKSKAHSSAISGSQLFAGTYNRGVWRMPLSTAYVPGNPIKQQPKIHSNFMRGRSTISYAIASSCFVTLSLYSISGKLLSTIVNKALSPGNYTAAISRNVAAGFYVLKFKAGNYEVTDKLLLQ